MQNPRDVYVDKILTNVFLGYPQQGYAAEEILPTLNVPDLTGLAFKLDESKLKIPAGGSLRAELARAKRIQYGLSQVSYGPLMEHSLENAIPDAIMRLYDAPLTPETTATEVVSKQLLNEKEVAVRDQVVTAANYAAGYSATLSGSSQWSDPTSPLESVVLAARRKVRLGSGNYPNVAVMNPDVRDALRVHNEVKARLAGAVAITDAQRDTIIADIFKVDKLVIADAVYTDQVDGSTTDGTKAWIWSDDVVLGYVTPTPALETLSLGYLLRLNPKHEVNGAPLVGVDKWYEREHKATIVRANDFYTTWFTANTAGYVWKDVLA